MWDPTDRTIRPSDLGRVPLRKDGPDRSMKRRPGGQDLREAAECRTLDDVDPGVEIAARDEDVRSAVLGRSHGRGAEPGTVQEGQAAPRPVHLLLVVVKRVGALPDDVDRIGRLPARSGRPYV